MDKTSRVRASTPRTRSGCANCRQRRIKCDETRPACQRCIRSGWACSGYDHSASVAPRNGSSSATARALLASGPALDITQYSLPFKVPGSQVERRALHYFANFAAADVSGHLPSDFWSRTILQRCQHDVPIRHAAAALGRAHMEYISANETANFTVSKETADAYGKAIKAVRNYVGRNSECDKSMILICSAIFYCFELLCSERRGALQHLESATKILRGWQDEPNNSNSNDASKTRDELLNAFVRLELQAAYYDDGRLPQLHVKNALISGSQLTPFGSLQEVQDVLFSLLHSGLTFLVQNTTWKFADISVVPKDVSSLRKQLLDQYDMLREKMSKTDSSILQSGDSHQSVLAVFKLHWQTGRLLLLHSLQDDMSESAPSFDDVAEELLQLARMVVETHRVSEHSNSSCNHGQSRPSERSFSLHLGIITPILLLALKTQQSHVRVAAVELLKAAEGRREGFHDAEITASLISGLQAETVNFNAGSPDESGSSQALEWIGDAVMDVKCWENDAERLDGWERLWATAA